MFDYKTLKYVITVAEEGGFTAASRKLNIAQSAISRQIANLEEDLGGTLFLRQKQGIEVTQAGQKFIIHARKILRDMRHVRDEVSSLLGEPSGSIVVGVPPTAGQSLMPTVFRICSEEWPLISLKVREIYSVDIYQSVLDNTVDIGLVHAPLAHPDLSIFPLVAEQMHFISHDPIPFEKSIAIEWLAQQPLILPDSPFGLRELLDEYALDNGVELNVCSSVNGASITKSMVAEGLGSTVLTRSAVVNEVDKDIFYSKPLDPPLTWQLCMLMRQDRAGNRSFVEIHKIAERAVRELLEKMAL